MRIHQAFRSLPLLALCLPLALTACDDDTSSSPAPAPAADVVSVVSADARLSTLTAAVVRVGLDSELAKDGPFTLFAPVDGAFAGVDLERLDDDTLRAILSRHVVAGRLEAEQVIAADRLTALDGTELVIANDGGTVTINGAAIQETDIAASNGVIHLTAAIIPAEVEPPAPAPSLLELVGARDDLSTLGELVAATGLASALEGDEPLTVFAPTDAAFDALPMGVIAGLEADPAALTQVLTYHVVAGAVRAADLDGVAEVNTVAMLPLAVDTSNGVTIGGATVTEADLVASNGVVHIIDGVLVPEVEPPPANDIVSIAVNDGRFGTLVAAVEAAGLAETLAGDGPFTVFAPTDAAFAALPEGTVETLLQPENRDQLVDILTYHVVDGAVPAAEVVGQSLVTMLNGDRARVTVDGDTVRIDGAQVIITDIQADNGIIHVIDAVILPPTSLAETLAADGRFTTLLAAVEAAGIADALDDVTVFAPTDAAFAALPEGTVEGLLQPDAREALIEILTFHVVGDDVPAADALAQMTFPTAANWHLFVGAGDAGAWVNEAGIVETDLVANNGLIHVIDTVLLPPAHLVDVAADARQFTTLAAAVDAAGLLPVVTDADANLAVFAPTDAAFAALPEGALEGLLANPEALAEVLQYHVVPGAPDAAAVTASAFLPTAGRTGLPVQLGPEGVRIGDATVVITDLPAPNGVIHVIDAVLLPPANIVETAREAGDFGTLLTALDAAGLTDAVADGGPFTVFAPADAAFAALPEGALDGLLADPAALSTVLQFHVVPGLYPAAALSDGDRLSTLANDLDLSVGVGQGVTINGASVVAADIWTGNGIIHVVDSVLLPPQ